MSRDPNRLLWLRAGRLHALRVVGRVLVAFCIVLLLLFAASYSHAIGTIPAQVVTPTTKWEVTGVVRPWEQPLYDSSMAVCNAWADAEVRILKPNYPGGPATHSGGTVSFQTGTGCIVTGAICTRNGQACGTDTFTLGNVAPIVVNVLTCGGGSTQNGAGQCQCDRGKQASGNSCVPYQCPAGSSQGENGARVGNTGPFCSGGGAQGQAGCVVAPLTTSCATINGTNTCYGVGPFVVSGGFCNPGGADAPANSDGAAPTPAPPGNGDGGTCKAAFCPGENSCAPGYVGASGSVNGTAGVACSPATTTGGNSASGSGSGNGGAINNTTSNTTNNTTTNNTTNVSGGGQTSGGPASTAPTAPGGPGTPGEESESFCAENPASPLCKTGAFGGACAAGFTCDGDAIQCAIAKDQHTRNCQLFDTPSAQSDVGIAAVASGDRPADHPANSPDAADMAFSSRIDQTDRLGSGALADLVVPVGARSVTIPFSQLTSSLVMLGNLLVGVTMLAAAFIVFRRS